MTGAAFRAMFLGFVRDRGALAMSLLLPVVFFLVFAAIFTGASGQHLRLQVALHDEVRSETSARLFRALRRERAVVAIDAPSAADARDRVRNGSADVGLVVRAGGEPLGSLGGFGKPPLLLIVDPSKAVAGEMLRGLAQRAYFRALPDVALGGVARLIEDDLVALSREQQQELAAGLEDLKQDALAAETSGRDAEAGFEDMFEAEPAAGRSAGQNHVAYYAGAVAILFLFFSTVHGALSLLEERDAGVLDRVLAGPGGLRPLVAGKLLFLAGQGFVQVTVIFVVAWLVHGVDLPGRFAPYALVTAASAVAAAALSLLVVSACRTRRQAQTVANVVILIASAVGGSMVPRFFMPERLQAAGWLTPTTWALEAYSAIFWRDEEVAALALPVALLLGSALLAALVTLRLTARWERV